MRNATTAPDIGQLPRLRRQATCVLSPGHSCKMTCNPLCCCCFVAVLPVFCLPTAKRFRFWKQRINGYFCSLSLYLPFNKTRARYIRCALLQCCWFRCIQEAMPPKSCGAWFSASRYKHKEHSSTTLLLFVLAVCRTTVLYVEAIDSNGIYASTR